MARRLRTKPASIRPNVSLTPRCLEVLYCIATLGRVSTEQVAREFFPSVDRARRRLRQLTDARLLDAVLVSSQSSNILTARRETLLALADQGFDVSGLKPATPPRLSAVFHELLVVELRLYCANLQSAGHGELLGWDAGRGESARALGLSQARIAPDGILRLRLGSTEGLVVAEADCGFEDAALAEKLERYGLWLPTQTRTELWLVAEGSEARLRRVATLCNQAGISRFTRLLTPQHLKARPTLPPVPRLARQSSEPRS